MLQHVVVEDFQSIEKVDLELGRLTVIVGASSSGKSAFLRAVRSLFRNTVTPSIVRAGANLSRIVGQFEDGTVSLERGKGASTYRVKEGDATEEVYPKSGTSVPDVVEKFLRAPTTEGLDLLFTFQFDRPFLLSESGATAARVLGELTNASLLHESVREANRRRLERTQRLKVRKQDVEDAKARLVELRNLPEQKKVLDECGDLLRAVRNAHARAQLLLEYAAVADAASEGLSAQTLIADHDYWEELDGLRAAQDRVKALDFAVARVVQLAQKRKAAQAEAVDLEKQVDQAEHNVRSLLQEAGTCPMCGRAVGE